MQHSVSCQRPVVETMEDRILHSADLAPVLVSDAGTGFALHQSLQQSANDTVQRSHEIAFVDLSVPDADRLLQDLQAQQTSGRAIEIVAITQDQDGLALITDTLAARQDITAVHVLAHGSDGRMQLGNVQLDGQTLMARADSVASWAGALTGDADLLLYGCDFAQTGIGQQLVRDLALLTGADVAASIDPTGAVALGGNWTLEQSTGSIEAASLFGVATQQDWQATLSLLASDAFASTGILNGMGGGAGWSNTWNGSTGPLVIGAGLVDPGAVLPVSGGSVRVQASGGITSVAVSRDMAASVGANGTTTWISFLLQPNGSGLLHYGGIEFGSGSATTGFAGYVGNNFEVGPAGPGSNSAVSGISATSLQTALLVLRIEHAVGNDAVTLYVNPTPGETSPAATFSASASVDLSSFTRIAVVGGQAFGNANTLLDEIRVGQSYADVAPSRAPIITSNGGGASAGVSIPENTTAVTTVTATDFDGPATTFALAGGADASRFSIGTNTGMLQFIAAPDFETPLDVGANNVYDVIVRASDGTFSDTQAIAVTVTDIGGPIAVTTTDDALDGDVNSVEALLVNKGADGLISLREAITASNNSPGTDLIILPAGNYTLTRTGGSEDFNVRGDLDVRENLTILGAGAASTSVSAGGLSEVFNVISGSLTMSGLTVRDGVGSGVGGGIVVEGGATLNLSQAVVSNNSAAGSGGGGGLSGATGSTIVLDRVQVLGNSAGAYAGGIYINRGTLIITDSTVDGNSTDNWGGGIYNDRSTTTLTRVTVSNNTAGKDGAGIYSAGVGAALALSNTTLSGNIATGLGGGVYTDRAATIVSSTIANNSASSGAGLQTTNSATLSLRNSIVASNAGGNSNRAIASLGNNLDSGATLGLNQVGDLSNTDPLLVALAFNGGYTRTHAVLAASAAINAADAGSAPITDQRGLSRYGGADIGAFEYNGGVKAPLESTLESRVNTTTGNAQETSAQDRGSHRAVAMANNGDHVVVWSSQSQDNGGSWGVYGQRYNAGGVPVGSEFRVNQATADDQRWATVVIDASGRFVVTWTSANQDGTALSVYARIFNADASAAGSEFRVNTTSGGSQSNGSIAMDAQRNFVIVWQGNGPGDTDGIFGRRFTATGAAIDAVEFRVNTDLARAHFDPSVSMNAGGAFAVTWDNNLGVQVQRYASNGAALGANTNVSPDVSSGNGSIALADDGSMVVVWRQTIIGPDVFMRRFDSNGSVLGAAVQVNTATTLLDQTSPSLTMDADRNVIVAWEGNGALDGSGVYGKKFDASGSVVGGEFLINTTTSGTQAMTSLAMADLDNFVAVWSGNGPGDSSGVFARQFGTANAMPSILAPTSISVLEDVVTVISGISFTDADAGVSSVTASFTVGTGTLTAGASAGVSITGSGSTAVTLIGSIANINALVSANNLVFTTAANAGANLQLAIGINDGGNTGSDGPKSASANTSLNVTAVNDAPSGSSKTVTTLEDVPYAFTVADFGFSDASDNPANNLLTVRITSLPLNGTLRLDGVAVAANQFVSAADIGLGRLVFSPLGNANGTAVASFLFRVQDDGGTANGGVNLDTVARTMTVNAGSVNDAPTGANKTVVALEDTAYTFLVSDFGFSDSNDGPANALASVRITALPGAGSLTLSGAAVASNQFISVANISAGNLRFTPTGNANGSGYASFTYRVQDDGGTANGGVDLDPVARTMTIDVTSDNDAPSGASKTVTTPEDTNYVFTAADFGFSDTGDTPADTLANVRIASLPADGSLQLNGMAISGVQFVSVGDINTGKLVFVPVANANGNGYVGFTFQVQDGGGTANGGVDLDPVARTITVNLTSVNDAPIGTDNTVVLPEDGFYVFNVADFGFSDPDDSPGNNLSHVRITALPGAGSLTLTGSAVATNQFVTVGNINAGHLRFTPAPNGNGAPYSSFTFQVQDNGGTSNGGVRIATANNTMALQVTAGNDPPENLVPGAQSINSNTPLVFSPGNGNPISVSDPDAGTNLILVTLSAADGVLTLSSVAGLNFGGGGFGDGTADASMRFTGTIASIDAALDGLRFDPSLNFAGGTSITLVSDDLGNSGSGGARSDTDVVTVNVSFVNSAPVLTGANDLMPTFEDAVNDAGTAVSALIAGHVSDANPMSASGIAVTGWDNSNGSWQFSLDGGANWNGFGSPVANTARLLGADANTFVRFVASPNWSGTVTNGLMFKAWDQTSGLAGDMASVALTGDPTAFSVASTSASVLVTAVNDAPTGLDRTITMPEDASRVLVRADFGFSDSTDTPPNNLLAVRIGTLPSVGTLTMNGTMVLAGDFVSVLDIDAGKLVFAPAAHGQGMGYANFDFQLRDDGGTANGGVDLDPASHTLTFDLTPVNDAPVGADATLQLFEDASRTLTLADFGFSDSNDSPSNNPLAVRINSLPLVGMLTLDGLAVAANQFVTTADILAGDLAYRADPDANGPAYAGFTFQLRDDGGVADGGADTDPIPRTLSFDVVSVNDAPTGANNAVTMLEDAAHVFSVAEFGFADAADTPADLLRNVRINSLPGGGDLTLDGLAVASDQFVSAADIAAGRLVFAPVANANGSNYASFTFRVQDDGGSANGGSDLDAIARTMTLHVDPVNDAPLANGSAVLASIPEDTVSPVGSSVAVLYGGNFGDAADGGNPGSNQLAGIAVVGQVDDARQGRWQYSIDAGVNWNAIAPVSDATALTLDSSARLRFLPATDYNGVPNALSVRLLDNSAVVASGSTVSVAGHGGASAISSAVVSTTTAINSVNDAPVGADRTVAMREDTSYTFTLADFGFTDPGDSPANNLANVRVTGLPSAGSLTLFGLAVANNQFVSAASIVAGSLAFTPLANGNGAGYANFSFRVHDDGGTANAGIDLDAVDRIMTLDVSAVNDAPQGSDVIVATAEDTPYVFSLADFGFSDSSDTPANRLLFIAITSTPQDGTLTRDGIAASAPQLVSRVELVAGKLRYAPPADASGLSFASFTFLVQDDGGTDNGGSDLDPLTRTATIRVDAANDTPAVLAPPLIVANEDTAVVVAGIFFSDPDAGPGMLSATLSVDAGSLSAASAAGVTVTGTGSAVLQLAGNLIDLNAFVLAGQLTYTPAQHVTADATLTITINDGGNTGSGGPMSASTSSRISINPINDAPTVITPASINLTEDTASSLAGIRFDDVDAETGAVTATFSVASGALIATAGPGVAIGGNSSALTLTGSIADINSLIASGGLSFTSAADNTDNLVLGIGIDDGGNSGAGAALSAGGSTTLLVGAVNDAPAIIVAASIGVTEDVDSPLAAIRIVDPDAGAGSISVVFSVASGTLTAGSGAGIAVTSAGSAVRLSGSIVDINGFIAAGRVGFTTATDATASVRLDISVDDGGNAGAGGPRVANASTMLDVLAVNDAPRLVSAPPNQQMAPSTTALFQIPQASFMDPDAGDSLQYSASRSDATPLPQWLRFDAATRTFTAEPSTDAIGSVQVRVLATDASGAVAQSDFTIAVAIAPQALEPVTPDPEPAPAEAKPAESKPEASRETATVAKVPAAEPAPDVVVIESTSVANSLERSNGTMVVEVDLPGAKSAARTFQFDDVATAVPASTNSPLLAAALLTQQSDITLSNPTQTFAQNDDMVRTLEELKRQLAQLQENEQIPVISAIALSSGLSIGYVIWLIRGGVLVSSMLSAIPAWQMIDPLPVVTNTARSRRQSGPPAADDPELERLFDERASPAAAKQAAVKQAAAITPAVATPVPAVAPEASAFTPARPDAAQASRDPR